MLSNAAKYAINAVLYLASNASIDHKLGAKEIGKEVNLPPPFLAKLLQDLAKKKVITSAKGPKGGFYLTPENLDQALLVVVEVIDGLDKFNTCVLGLNKCSKKSPCPIHYSVSPLREKLLSDLTKNTIAEYAKKVSNGETFLTL